MSRYNKQKGAQGERDVAEMLRKFGFDAWRQGKQFFREEGRVHEDVTHNIEPYHLEVKRTKEKLDIPAAFRQARAEKPDKVPVVIWRGNRQPWRAIMDLEDWLQRERELEDLREALRTHGVH